MCSICQMTVHKKCASLESDVKITAHHHPLKLNWLFQGNRPMDEYHCKICYKLADALLHIINPPIQVVLLILVKLAVIYVAHTSCLRQPASTAHAAAGRQQRLMQDHGG